MSNPTAPAATEKSIPLPHHLCAKELVRGQQIGLRMWECGVGSAADDMDMTRAYVQSHESVLYCISGKASLNLAGQQITIAPGQSWLIPENAPHTCVVCGKCEPQICTNSCLRHGARCSYKIIDGPFKAIEAVGPEQTGGIPQSSTPAEANLQSVATRVPVEPKFCYAPEMATGGPGIPGVRWE